jgi:SAM-dependent methyltransferase
MNGVQEDTRAEASVLKYSGVEVSDHPQGTAKKNNTIGAYKKMEYRKIAPALREEDYAKCFKTYKKISSEWKSMFYWIQDNLRGNLPDKENFSVLSIGSGTGDFDFQFIQILKSKFKNLEYVALEPNEVFCQEFKTRIASIPIHNVKFETHSVPFEEFNIGKRFDLIHLTHCLYYISDRQRAILKALDMIFDDGLVLIFIQTPMGINHIQRMFLKRIKGSGDEMFSSKELQAILDHHQIPYQLDVVDSFLDISDCFRANSEAGEDLLSFILESDVRQLFPSVKREIVDYLQELSFYNQERRLIFHPVAIFSLFKRTFL